VTAALTPSRSGQWAGHNGFTHVVHAEWTKFRTVRGWVTGMVAAALMVVLFALLAGVSGNQKGSPPVPVRPGGEPVTDSFYFVHQPLAGNGSVSVSALNSSIPDGPGDLRSGTVPWAKAGLIIKDSTHLGSLPISPWAGLGVTAGWAAAALLAGGLLLRIRDA
jgi:hypothetical protein